MNLFPSIQPAAAPGGSAAEMFREIKWDFENNVPVYKNGSPVIVEGGEAVLVWAWKALHTPRYRHEIYTRDYGNEAESLIGQPYSEELKRAEAARYVEECLLINPYILSVSNVSVEFSDGAMNISCTIKTVYGEVEISV